MRVSTWYQEPTREDDDPHLPSSSRVRDVFTGTNRTSYQVREPIENDEERFAMNRGDMPSPLPKRMARSENSRRSSVTRILFEKDKKHRATSDDAFTQAWFDYS